MELFEHQRRFGEIVRSKPCYLWAAEPGCGKTIGTLAVIAERPVRTVVVAPISVVESAWTEDAKHFPTLKVVALFSDSKRRVSTILHDEWDVLCLGPEMFKKHAKDLIAANARRLVFDESGKLRNPDSQITKATIAFADLMDEVYLLSGTPAPNGPHEYWGQMRAMRATQLPSIKWLYKHFYPIKEPVRVRGGAVKSVVREWRQSPTQAKGLVDELARCSWVLRKADCLDLPPQLDRVVRVRLGPEEAEAYAAAQHELRIIMESGESAGIKAGAALVKLRQIVGGAVLVEGKPNVIGSSKLNALGEVLDSLGPQPVVIWTQFRHERERIEALLVERKETYGIIDGETSRDAGLSAAMFQAGKLQRLLCHPQAAGHGITLHAASHAIYYALDFSHDGHRQSRDRIHRAGMGDAPATYWYLLAELPAQEKDGRRTVDDAMMGTLRRKAKAADGIMDALRDAGCRVEEECAAIGE